MKNGKPGFRLPDKKILIGVATVLSLASYLIATEQYKTQVKLDSEASKLWDEEKLKEAAEAYTSAMNVDEGNRALFLAKRGAVYWEAGEREKALDDYDNAIKLDPTNGFAYCVRGEAFRQQDKLKEALDDLNKSIKLLPDFADSYVYRGYTKAELGDQKSAIADYTKALKLGDGSDKSIYSWRAEAFIKSQQYDAAIKDAQEALKYPEQSPDRYYDFLTLARAYFQKQKYDASIAYCNKAIKLDPEREDGYLVRPSAFIHLDKLQEAVNDFSKAISINPDDASTWERRAKVYCYLGQYDLAKKDMKKAISLDPKDEMLLISSATIHLFFGKTKEALIDYAAALKINPENEYAKQEMEDVKANRVDIEWFRNLGCPLTPSIVKRMDSKWHKSSQQE